MMASDCDLLLWAVVGDLDVYRRFQAEQIDGIESLKTEISLQRIKITAALPI